MRSLHINTFLLVLGTPINKPPVLGYKDLNLFKLFRLVYQQGGCDNVSEACLKSPMLVFFKKRNRGF